MIAFSLSSSYTPWVEVSSIKGGEGGGGGERERENWNLGILTIVATGLS